MKFSFPLLNKKLGDIEHTNTLKNTKLQYLKYNNKNTILFLHTDDFTVMVTCV